MQTKTLNGIPVELVEVVGNLIRKIAYTQLEAVRLIGIGICDSSGKWYTLTDTISGTTTMLDIVAKLAVSEAGEIALTDISKESVKDEFIESKSFTNLSRTLFEILGRKFPDDLCNVTTTHMVHLQFKKVSSDMSADDLQSLMHEDGFIPIPCSVLSNFVLDYSRKSEGILSYSCPDELFNQLTEKVAELSEKIRN